MILQKGKSYMTSAGVISGPVHPDFDGVEFGDHLYEVIPQLDEKSGHVSYVASPRLTPYQEKQIEINRLEDLYPGEHKFTTETYLAFVKSTLDDLQVLIKAKNADYTNGKGPFANFEQSSDFGVDPFKGLMLRVGDKMQRIKSYCSKGELQVANEGVEDALKDLIGYSLIGLAMLKERGGK